MSHVPSFNSWHEVHCELNCERLSLLGLNHPLHSEPYPYTQCCHLSPSPVPTTFEHYLSILSVISPFFDEDFFSFSSSSSSEYYLSSAFSYFPYYYLLLNPFNEDDDDRKTKKKRRKRQRVAVLFVDYPVAVLSHLANTELLDSFI